MGLADTTTGGKGNEGKKVSILVLMDGARRQLMRDGSTANNMCFNPCFDGWGSPTRLFVVGKAVASVFQSLF